MLPLSVAICVPSGLAFSSHCSEVFEPGLPVVALLVMVTYEVFGSIAIAQGRLLLRRG